MSSYFDNKELFTGPKMNQYGSHMVMTNVTKAPKIKYVNIDTKFRDEYNSNITTDYTITLPERITDVRSISVTNVEVPNTFFNISDNIGNNSAGFNQASEAIAIGDNAGNDSQKYGSVAIGYQCGSSGQGSYSIAIGFQAGYTGQ